ncbi:MAG: DUF6893 family small protein [Solirubrobacterales bacterium]
MSEKRVSPAAQWIALGAIMAAIAAGIAQQLPELKRYLKVRAMS